MYVLMFILLILPSALSIQRHIACDVAKPYAHSVDITILSTNESGTLGKYKANTFDTMDTQSCTFVVHDLALADEDDNDDDDDDAVEFFLRCVSVANAATVIWWYDNGTVTVEYDTVRTTSTNVRSISKNIYDVSVAENAIFECIFQDYKYMEEDTNVCVLRLVALGVTMSIVSLIIMCAWYYMPHPATDNLNRPRTYIDNIYEVQELQHVHG